MDYGVWNTHLIDTETYEWYDNYWNFYRWYHLGKISAWLTIFWIFEIKLINEIWKYLHMLSTFVEAQNLAFLKEIIPLPLKNTFWHSKLF